MRYLQKTKPPPPPQPKDVAAEAAKCKEQGQSYKIEQAVTLSKKELASKISELKKDIDRLFKQAEEQANRVQHKQPRDTKTYETEPRQPRQDHSAQ